MEKLTIDMPTYDRVKGLFVNRLYSNIERINRPTKFYDALEALGFQKFEIYDRIQEMIELNDIALDDGLISLQFMSSLLCPLSKSRTILPQRNNRIHVDVAKVLRTQYKLTKEEFVWPLASMAEFEFGNSNHGGDMSRVVVVTGIPTGDRNTVLMILHQIFGDNGILKRVVMIDHLHVPPDTITTKDYLFIIMSSSSDAERAALLLNIVHFPISGLASQLIHQPEELDFTRLKAQVFHEYMNRSRHHDILSVISKKNMSSTVDFPSSVLSRIKKGHSRNGRKRNDGGEGFARTWTPSSFDHPIQPDTLTDYRYKRNDSVNCTNMPLQSYRFGIEQESDDGENKRCDEDNDKVDKDDLIDSYFDDDDDMANDDELKSIESYGVYSDAEDDAACTLQRDMYQDLKSGYEDFIHDDLLGTHDRIRPTDCQSKRYPYDRLPACDSDDIMKTEEDVKRSSHATINISLSRYSELLKSHALITSSTTTSIDAIHTTRSVSTDSHDDDNKRNVNDITMTLSAPQDSCNDEEERNSKFNSIDSSQRNYSTDKSEARRRIISRLMNYRNMVIDNDVTKSFSYHRHDSKSSLIEPCTMSEICDMNDDDMPFPQSLGSPSLPMPSKEKLSSPRNVITSRKERNSGMRAGDDASILKYSPSKLWASAETSVVSAMMKGDLYALCTAEILHIKALQLSIDMDKDIRQATSQGRHSESSNSSDAYFTNRQSNYYGITLNNSYPSHFRMSEDHDIILSDDHPVDQFNSRTDVKDDDEFYPSFQYRSLQDHYRSSSWSKNRVDEAKCNEIKEGDEYHRAVPDDQDEEDYNSNDDDDDDEADRDCLIHDEGIGTHLKSVKDLIDSISILASISPHFHHNQHAQTPTGTCKKREEHSKQQYDKIERHGCNEEAVKSVVSKEAQSNQTADDEKDLNERKNTCLEIHTLFSTLKSLSVAASMKFYKKRLLESLKHIQQFTRELNTMGSRQRQYEEELRTLRPYIDRNRRTEHLLSTAEEELDQARNQLYHADSRLQELEEECKGLHQQLLFEQNQIRPSLRHDLNPSYDDLLRIATTLARVKSSSLSESCDYQIEKLTQLQNQLEVALVNVKLSRTETECRQAMLKLQQEQQLKSSEDASICCICRDQLRSILLLPCRHFCLCEECSHGILIDDNRASSSYMTSTMINCPVCRQRITGKMKIFS